MLPSTEAVYGRRAIAHYSPSVRQWTVGDPLPTTSQQCGSVLKHIHCPPLPSSEAVY